MSRATRFIALAPIALVALQACATGYGSRVALESTTLDTYAAQQPHIRSSTDLISARELSAAGGGTAYDVVYRLRPQFFAVRASGFAADPYGGRAVVYFNGMRLGGVDELRTIPISMVGEVRFLTAAVGSEWFGRYHPGGVIAITSPK